MRTAAALLFAMAHAILHAGTSASQVESYPPSSISEPTPFSIHNLYRAHEVSLGVGVKVGILDHSFGLEAHPDLYAGAKAFLAPNAGPGTAPETHRGYWMALSVREIAPKAEIFALEIPTGNSRHRSKAMVRALEWAVENGLDAITYCGGSFSEADRKILDPAVEKAIKAGVVVVFVDYHHPMNLLPGNVGDAGPHGGRDPDLNIFSPDCGALRAGRFLALAESDDDGIQRRRPFLASPSSGPIVLGMVALMRSLDPEVSPGEIKRVLVETSRAVEYDGILAERVPDALQALLEVASVGPR